MAKNEIHPEILKSIKLITGKRSLVVVNHIIKHGQITTEDLENYGYKHPPRAIRDVREQGLPLERFWTKNSEGQKIAGYRFGDPTKIKNDRIGGRKVFSKDFILEIIAQHNNKCAICQAKFENRYLQIDHKIPYEVSGDDSQQRNPQEYMPLCVTCNRAKSWSCEHCLNWASKKNKTDCQICYWGNPETYTHVALQEIRRLQISWQKEEIPDYEKLKSEAGRTNQSMPDYVKKIIKNNLR